MTKAEAIQFAKRELRDSAAIDVIGELEIRGFGSMEAEEIVEEALLEMEEEP